jgi:hypothetical protein
VRSVWIGESWNNKYINETIRIKLFINCDIVSVDGVRFPVQERDVSVIHVVQTGSGAEPASCLMGTGGNHLVGITRLGHEADHSPPSSAEVKNGGAIRPLPYTSS